MLRARRSVGLAFLEVTFDHAHWFVVLSGTDDDYVHFIYFSLASLTTVGFGDVHALNTAAKMLATFLSTPGVLFPAIVIARLVGLASSRN